LTKIYKHGGPVPLTRIKTLVSMTTPRDFRAHGSCTLPPFVEMDMAAEGFGCLYLPSIAPQAPNAGGNLDGTIIGGIGSGDRAFPAQTGLSYSTWFCVDKFSDPRTDPHCVRLLTLIRTINNPREDNLVCLTVLLSARDKAIIVSTQETLVPHSKFLFMRVLRFHPTDYSFQMSVNGNRKERVIVVLEFGVQIFCMRANGIIWWLC
jgi:WD repeat and FYVE domain-containing protein 3